MKQNQTGKMLTTFGMKNKKKSLLERQNPEGEWETKKSD
jgi:hypothetical protein